MRRKKVERKNDLIICSKSGMELGCGEAGLCRSVDNKQEVIKKLQVVGLIRMLIMDCPDGYVCRLKGTTAAGFSGEEKTLGLGFRKAMEVCKKVESIVQSNRSTAEIKFESDDNHSNDD
ncbi:hypothetical protein BDF21DRAFT_437872 [Thamnidium elegans]|nr:hypothetical protein BDF21DRAFT_437872 [Thamnidium elegans]